MGAMTMDFKLPASGLPRNVVVGDTVQFEFVLPPDDEATLTRIVPLAPAPTPPAAGAAR